MRALSDQLLPGVLAVLLAILAGRILKLVARRLSEARPDEERELRRLRRRETAIVLLATAIPYVTAIVVLIVLASIFLPAAAALGGSAFLAVMVGFAAQRFLMDVLAGTLIAFERWYGVGDFVAVEPSKATGIVEQFGLRTTIVRSLNGDLTYVPNSQINAIARSPKGYRRYTIELLTSDSDAARRAIEAAGARAPVGEARFLGAPRVLEERELGDDVWLVRGSADVAPTMEWLAEHLLVQRLASQLNHSLLAEPVAYTLDQGTLTRYERRVLVR